MSQRNLIIITKIILFYSIFVVAMKLIYMVKQYSGISNDLEEEVILPLIYAQFLLLAPFIALGAFAFLQNKKNQYSWIFVFVAAVTIIALRVYELQVVQYLQESFRS